MKIQEILSTTRYEANISQEKMASELNVTKRTIHNWETGKSEPTLSDILAWFKVLNINPTPYVMELCNQHTMDNISPYDDDEKIRCAVMTLIEDMPSNSVRALLYILYGSHGGDPISMLNLFLAYAHLPMINRVGIAQQVLELYNMCEARDEVKDIHHILPNIDTLAIAIEQGRIAAKNNKDGYNTF